MECSRPKTWVTCLLSDNVLPKEGNRHQLAGEISKPRETEVGVFFCFCVFMDGRQGCEVLFGVWRNEKDSLEELK